MKSQITATTHPYLINLPQDLFVALKLRAAIANMSVKDLIITSVEDKLSKDFGSKNSKKPKKNDRAFLASSNQSFAREWGSQADEKAFAHLQKHLKKTNKKKK